MTRIIVEGKELDIINDVDVEFTYTISDLREIDKRKTSFSKTIVLPNTPNNANIFGYIFDVAVETEYDPLQKNIGINFNPGKIAKCNIYKDNVIIFNGVLRLIEIIIVDGEITYECNVFGKLKDILYKLKESYIDELNWDDTIVQPTLSDKINRMQNKYIWGGGPVGEFNYPLVDYGNTPNWKDIEQLNILPQVFVREIIKRIFDFAQFTFDCPFFNTNYFKRLLLISGGGKNEYLRKEWVSFFHSNFVGSGACGAFLRPSISGFNDYGAATEFTTGVIFGGPAIRFNRTEQLSIRFQDEWTISIANIRCQTFYVKIGLWKHVAGSGTASQQQGWYYENNYQNPNPGVYPWSILDTVNIDTAVTINEDSPGNEWFYIQMTVQPVGAGTSGGCQIGGNYNYIFSQLTFEGSFFYSPTPIPAPVNRKPVPIGTYISHIKCTDFLKSIILMHNLFIETNPLNDTELIITPYPLYYDDFKVNADDWTDLLDRSQEIKITPLSELTNFEYVFTYDDDNDYWTEVYKRRWFTNYGSAIITIDNDFLPEQKRSKVVFGPPIMITNDSKTMIHLYKVDLNTGQKKPDNFKSRIAVCNFQSMPTGESWIFRDSGTSQAFNMFFYQYAGHLDDPRNPTYDILFGPPQEIYFQTDGAYTNSNLYSVYWEILINRISDHNSRLLTAYFYLTPNIIQNLDFARLIKVGNHYYILISIENYNPNGDGLAKAQLFKIKEGLLQQDLNFILQENDDYLLQENDDRLYQ
jgi:hypothetical protein